MNDSIASGGRKSTRGKWAFRVAMTVVFVCAVVYGVLALAEKNPDPMRLGIEDYLEKLTGEDAQIDALSKLELVPRVVFGMKDVTVRDKETRQRTLLRAREAYISLPFWAMFSGAGEYYAIQAKNVEIASGYGLPRKTTLGFFGISDADPSGPAPSFMADGSYDGKPLLVTAEMERHRGRQFYSYSFAREYPLTFKLGAIEGDGVIEREADGGKFKKVQMVMGEHKVDFVLRHLSRDSGPLEAEGSIDGVEFTGLQTERDGKSVFLISPRDASADRAKISAFLKALNDYLGYGSTPFFVASTDTAKDAK